MHTRRVAHLFVAFALTIARLAPLAAGLGCTFSAPTNRSYTLSAVAVNAAGSSPPSSSAVTNRVIEASWPNTIGRMALAASGDGSMHFYSSGSTLYAYASSSGAWTLQAQITPSAGGAVQAVWSSADGTRVVAHAYDTVFFYDYDKTSKVFTLRGSTTVPVYGSFTTRCSVSISSDNTRILVVLFAFFQITDGNFRMFTRSGTSWVLSNPTSASTAYYRDISSTPNMQLLAFITDDGAGGTSLGIWGLDASSLFSSVAGSFMSNEAYGGGVVMYPNGTRIATANGRIESVHTVRGSAPFQSVYLELWSNAGGNWARAVSFTDTAYGSLGNLRLDPTETRLYVLARRIADNAVCLVSYQYVEAGAQKSFVRDRVFPITGQTATTAYAGGWIAVSPSGTGTRMLALIAAQSSDGPTGTANYVSSGRFVEL